MNPHLAAAARQAAMQGDTEFLENYAKDEVSVGIPERYLVYVNAYLMLDTERPDDLAYIPWSAYVNYGTFYGFSRDQIDWLIEIGLRVDRVILPERAKRHGNNTPGLGGKTKSLR